MGNWGDIPIDLAIKIAQHLKFYEDIDLFGSVCSLWRSAAKQAKLSANKYKMPWLLLPDPEHDNQCRRFYALYDRKVRTFNLPLDRRRLISSSHGWLLLASESRAADHLALVNPLSGVTINLPKVFCGIALITKMVLSGNPSTTLDFKVALILSHKIFPNRPLCFIIVAIWSNGDDKWSPVKCRESMIDGICNDVTFYRGQLYAVDNFGVVYCSLGGRGDCGPYKFIGTSTTADQPQTSYYLMESGGRLLVVCRIRSLVDIRDYRTWRTTRFYVYEMNFENRDVVWLPYLDRVAIFVGTNSSFSVEADGYNNIKPNSIYFTDNYRFEYYDMLYDDDDKDMGVYNLADGSIESHYDGPSHYCKYAPFMWLDAPSS